MFSRVLTIGVVTVIVAAVVGAGGWLYFFNFSPDRSKYPVRGIDVSHHQGSIDWQRVAADDVSFAIIKATEGGDYGDEEFLGNYLSARSLGIAVGAYHFFTFCRPAIEQAQNFIRTVPKDDPQLPPVVDIEFGGNCATRPGIEELAAELKVFTDRVGAEFGQPVVIYAIGEALEQYRSALPERAAWVRSLAWHPGHEDWVYWQYHNKGRVDGIEGDVDLNVLQGGRQLAELVR